MIPNITFSVNTYDYAGDIIDKGIYFHIDDTISIKMATNLEDLDALIETIKNIKKEIKENY